MAGSKLRAVAWSQTPNQRGLVAKVHNPRGADAMGCLVRATGALPAIFIFATLSVAPGEANKSQLPNILFILADDLG